MAYGLPERGQQNWDDELNNSVESLRLTAETAASDASTARSTALDAKFTALAAAASQAAGNGDAALANLIETGDATTAALSASIAQTGEARYAQRVGARIVFDGDSITAGSEGGSADHNARGFPMQVGMLSAGRIRVLRNAGNPGKRIDELAAAFDTRVLPYAPDAVHIMAGTNDATQGRTLSQFAADFIAYIAKVRAIGARPFVGILSANAMTTDRRSLTGQYAAWLRSYCAAEGIDTIDYYRLTIDPSTGAFTAALTSDGTHPKNGTNRQYAQLCVDTILDRMPTAEPLLPMDNADPWNLVTNGLFLGGTSGTTGPGGTIMPTGWTRSGGRAAGTTGALDTADANIEGNWWTLDATAATAGETWSQTLPSAKIIGGHRYLLTHRMRATGLRNANTGNGATFLSTLRFASPGTPNGNGIQGYDFRALSNADYDVEGVVAVEAVAPVDANSAQLVFISGVTTSSSYKARIAQVGVYDLTAMGLTTQRLGLDVVVAGQP